MVPEFRDVMSLSDNMVTVDCAGTTADAEETTNPVAAKEAVAATENARKSDLDFI
jgi:hypothetical protein